MIEIDRVLLRGNTEEGECIGRFTMISARIKGMWYDITDHAVLHRFFETFRDMFLEYSTEFLHRLFPVQRKFSYVVIGSFGCRLHGYIFLIFTTKTRESGYENF